jgi:protein-tyrosine phosphatase
MPQPIRPWYWPEKGQPERTETFTWIVEGVIAASWWPDPYVFDIYEEQNIRAIVNCYGVPTDAQIEHFVRLMDRHHAAREAVVVHCVAGCGRTGQFIVAWCAKAGFIPAKDDPVQWIRARRKYCLETREQTECAKRWMSRHRPS